MGGSEGSCITGNKMFRLICWLLRKLYWFGDEDIAMMHMRKFLIHYAKCEELCEPLARGVIIDMARNLEIKKAKDICNKRKAVKDGLQ